MWIVHNLLNGEDLIWLLRLTHNLYSGVELSTHYHQVLRLCQGVDGITSAEWAFIITSLQLNFLIFEKSFDRQKNANIFSSVLVGMAFGFGWTPCIGPILGSILALAAVEQTLFKAVLLLLFYSLGLAIPFILSGFLIQKFMLVSKNLKRNINIISKTGGFILLVTGILILTNQLQAVGFYLLKSLPFLQNLG